MSHSEYNRSIRDLTGIDIRPNRYFHPDPAAGEGFDNTGEALSTGPGLVRTYLSAAQLTADHLVLHTTGLRFAPFAVSSSNERRKLTENAVMDFYRNHDVDVTRHITGAWHYRCRTQTLRRQTAAEFAAINRLSPRYFTLLTDFLDTLPDLEGCPQELRDALLQLPPPPLAATEDSRSPVGPALLASPPPEVLKLVRLINHYRRLLLPLELNGADVAVGVQLGIAAAAPDASSAATTADSELLADSTSPCVQRL